MKILSIITLLFILSSCEKTSDWKCDAIVTNASGQNQFPVEEFYNRADPTDEFCQELYDTFQEPTFTVDSCRCIEQN